MYFFYSFSYGASFVPVPAKHSEFVGVDGVIQWIFYCVWAGVWRPKGVGRSIAIYDRPDLVPGSCTTARNALF